MMNRKVGLAMAATMFLVAIVMMLEVYTILRLDELWVGFISGFCFGLAGFQLLALMLGRRSP